MSYVLTSYQTGDKLQDQAVVATEPAVALTTASGRMTAPNALELEYSSVAPASGVLTLAIKGGRR